MKFGVLNFGLRLQDLEGWELNNILKTKKDMKVIFKGQGIELPVNESELPELIMVLHAYRSKSRFLDSGEQLNLDTDMIQEEPPRGKNW